MRTLSGFCLALLLATSVFAQHNGAFVNPGPVVRGSFPNIVFPGGTRGTAPGTVRTFGNVVFPGGGGPQPSAFAVRTPGPNFRAGALGDGSLRSFPDGRFGSRRPNVIALPYAVPVYVGGGFYDNPYLPQEPVAQQQQQPNVIVVYPQQQPIMLNGTGEAPPAVSLYQPEVPAPADQPQTASAESPQYLIAFKDHTIYSAVAFWVDGQTLHYFTSGNTHNQVSLSLIDKPLTERLNKESGVDLRLP